jgi:adhesin transport system outer membrane protein
MLMRKSIEKSVESISELQSNLIVPATDSAIDNTLDIGVAVKLAVNYYPSVTEAIGRLYETKEQIDVAKSGYYPQVGAGISNGYRSSSGRTEQAFTVSASQMLYDFGKVASLVDIAEFSVDRNYAAVLQAVDDLAGDTALSFIEVQRYQALLDIADQQIVAISELKSLAEERVKLGASSRSDEYQSQSRVQNAIALKLQLQAELDAWKRTLQNFIGSYTEIRAKQDFPEFLYDECSNGVGDLKKYLKL